MAKVRVYELAKEFNMDSKTLVEKLKTGGMNIKNYMSTLDESSISKAKDIVSGSVSEVIEEKRIKPTVIRRRKKKVRVEPAETPVAEFVEEDAEELKAPEDEIEVSEEPEVSEPSVDTEKAEEPEVAPEEIPVPRKRVKKAAKPEESAVIISEPPAKKEKKAPTKKAKKPEKPVEPAQDIKEPVAKKIDAAVEKAVEDKTKAGKKAKEVVKKEKAGKAVDKKDAPKAKEKSKKVKKKKIDQPAKIIKGPEDGPLKAVLGKKIKGPPKVERRTKVTPLPIENIPVSPEEKKDRPSRKKKDKKRGQSTDFAAKKSVRHRKVEIFERADLYEGKKIRGKKKDSHGKEGRKKAKQTEITVPKAIKRRIKILDKVTVADLGKAMGIKSVELVKKLITMGVSANINQSIDFETASLLADEFGYEVEPDQLEITDILTESDDTNEDLQTRPPVVTIMGHVDHGKTSLLDYIRKSNIIAGESGGITQHIGAYYVKRENGDIVFLDTPGHEAFTAMRARGAKITDIIVLVVAADDGVMPQTREAVNHARAANIPMIVAVNKIDKPEANIDKVLRELAELEMVPEDWGGDTIFGNISAKTGEGIDELMELILLQAEMLELSANPDKQARGTIIEAKLDKSRGSLATVLIKAGTLRIGDFFVCGETHGKIRAMLDHRGSKLKEAGPSVPVEVYGISGVPKAGEEFIVVKDEKSAKQVIDHRQRQTKSLETSSRGVVSLNDLFDKIKEGEVKELNIVLKADVQGSLEALSDSLAKLSTDEVKLKIIHASTGAITETDVMLASASSAIILGFNVRANPRVVGLAEREKIDIRYYDVIYNAIQDIRNAMAGLLDPIFTENVIGRAQVKEVFRVPKLGTVAGCQVTDGVVERNSNARLLRDEVVIYDGKLASLRRFKDDVKEVQTGYECGIGLDNYQDIKQGDVFEVYKIEETAAEL